MKNAVGMLAGGLILAGLLLAYTASSLQYPYYLLWDGDFVPVLDTLLIGDGQLPAHVHHPSLGVYLILSPISRIGHWAGWISIGRMSELFTALNPFPCVAELITCLRLAYPFLVLALVIALWLTMMVIFRPGWLASLGILLFLGVQESLFFDASMIRSESVSILFWSFALLVMAFAARAGTLRLKGALLLLAGFFLGLAFLTKVQSVVFVVIAAVFYLFLETLREDKTELSIPAAGKTILTFISVLTLIFFLFLFFTAWKQPVPCARSMDDWDRYFWAGYYGVEFSQWRGAGLPVLMALVAIILTNAFLLAIGKSRSWMYCLVAAAILLAAGFFLSFLCHFLLYSDPAQGFHYLLTNFKVAFFRDRRHFEPTTLNYNRLEWQAMAWHFRYLLGVHALLIGLLLPGKILRLLNIQWKSIGLLLTLSILAGINSSFSLYGQRYDLAAGAVRHTHALLCLVAFHSRTPPRPMAPSRSGSINSSFRGQ